MKMNKIQIEADGLIEKIEAYKDKLIAEAAAKSAICEKLKSETDAIWENITKLEAAADTTDEDLDTAYEDYDRLLSAKSDADDTLEYYNNAIYALKIASEKLDAIISCTH